MSRTSGIVIVVAVIVLAITPLAGQKRWTLGHTPDGQPDLQGVWTFATITPLERPNELAGKQSGKEFCVHGSCLLYEPDCRLFPTERAFKPGRSCHEDI